LGSGREREGGPFLPKVSRGITGSSSQRRRKKRMAVLIICRERQSEGRKKKTGYDETKSLKGLLSSHLDGLGNTAKSDNCAWLWGQTQGIWVEGKKGGVAIIKEESKANYPSNMN